MGLDKINHFEFRLTKRNGTSTKYQHQTRISFQPLLVTVLEKEQFYLKMYWVKQWNKLKIFLSTMKITSKPKAQFNDSFAQPSGCF